MRGLTLVILTLFFISAVNAQDGSKSFKDNFYMGLELLEEEQFEQARVLFADLQKQDPENANINFYLGYALLNSSFDREQAEQYLVFAEKNITVKYSASDHKEKDAPMLTIQLLGDAYHANEKFDLAIQKYEEYKALLDEGQTDLIEQLDRSIAICNTAKELVANPVKMEITNLGAEVNSPAPDYCPVVTADESTLYFTSRREGSTGGKLSDDGKLFEDIYFSEKDGDDWQKAMNLGEEINTEGHEATMGISADGQRILLYRNVNGDGGLYESELDGIEWSKPELIAAYTDINSYYYESHANYSYAEDLIVITSERPEGFGGRDIYFAKRLPNGNWAWVQNMGPLINTEFDEESPYLHPDGQTLYFSSKGHNTMGGFDVFMSKRDKDGNWTKPVNLGYPLNTTGDDVFFIPTTDGRHAYYSSYREGGYGDQDIYLIEFPEFESKNLTVLRGKILDEEGKIPQDVFITVTDNESGNVIGNYRPNKSKGTYLFILEPGYDYNITYESDTYLFHSENMNIPADAAYEKVRKDVILKKVDSGSKIVLKNLFFKFDSHELMRTSQVEIENVFKTLAKYKDIKVEIVGHTDSKGSIDYNMKLAERRAIAVVDYLVARGIDASRLSAKAEGEVNPADSNNFSDGGDNPLGRARNRRTELRIIE